MGKLNFSHQYRFNYRSNFKYVEVDDRFRLANKPKSVFENEAMNQGILIKDEIGTGQSLIIQALQERKIFFLEEFFDMAKRMDKVIDLSSKTAKRVEVLESEMILLEIQSFYEVTLVIQALKQQKTVFLDLTLVTPEIAQRVIDFLAGGAYAADCEQTFISENLFVLTPNCVTVSQFSE